MPHLGPWSSHSRSPFPLLADPGSHGADPEDAFDVVVPSLPGYGFSERLEGDGGIFGVGDL
jgi:hypothetical protein